MSFDQLTLVGDELRFEGELVALLTSNACSSNLGRFTNLIEFGPDVEEEGCTCPVRQHFQVCKFYKAEDGAPPDDPPEPNDVIVAARRLARGGLVRLADLEKEFT